MRFRVRRLLVVFALLAFYFLSTGPAAWLYSHKRIGPRTYYTYLAPLSLAGRIMPPIRTGTKWYVGLWSRQEFIQKPVP